jgi:hypothetical protein
MIEILLLVFLTKRLAKVAADRGRSPAWCWLAPALWIVAELFGFVVADALGVRGLQPMLFGVFFGAVGGGIAWLLVSGLAPAPWLVDGPDPSE